MKETLIIVFVLILFACSIPPDTLPNLTQPKEKEPKQPIISTIVTSREYVLLPPVTVYGKDDRKQGRSSLARLKQCSGISTGDLRTDIVAKLDCIDSVERSR